MAPPLAETPDRVASIMLGWHALELESCTTLQTLWAGYGHVCAITARATTAAAAAHVGQLCGLDARAAGDTFRLVLKLISPPRTSAGPQEEGHLRKMLSYEVEQSFYTDVVPRLGEDIAVAQCLASTRDMAGKDGEAALRGLQAMIMVDLRPRFPVAGARRGVLNRTQVRGALDWLAAFHSRSRDLLPDHRDGCVLPPLVESRARHNGKPDVGRGLWLNGGYTYLATRRTEYASLVEDTDSEWSDALCTPPEGHSRSIAEMAASVLTPRGGPFESYIHGDVKSENLFTTTNGDAVAFYDFQYVGLGLGVCDLAKLFTCSVPLHMLVDAEEPLPEQLAMGDGERQLLQWYRTRLLQDRQSEPYEWKTFNRHWETALVDWCRFQASWGFWGNTEWLQARVRSILGDREWRGWLYQNTRSLV
ncbi:hypothetical protein BO71DRAFT_400691 [Aspergillus ellipticus CBS 707.79]|uniref:Aminoglycoside phosphotransferase domain-containing protein n=1 Tax=Aspergillus ellipticus CBS 707.79 TaxID=1448320 RepID=A0A319D543_9EURO|nr:hypothetical protein BO71DRAFT_400691 [Aspergillus ellipticus CBS 707.79]